MKIDVVQASDGRAIETAFATLVGNKVEGLVVAADPFFISRRLQLATLATRHLIPAVYNAREYAEAGGLMTYGTSLTEVFRHISAYAIRILKGTNPADLPVVQPTKFDFVINLPTARALGLEIPADPARPRRRGDRMSRRREFITLLGGVAAAWPIAARGQQSGQNFRIGLVETTSAELNATNLAAFRRGLQELGYTEGRNLVLEYRSADGDASRFPALISELIGLKVDLIVARGTPAALAVKQATRTIPVIMAVGEPLLIVDSLARPGGNITGLSGVQPELETKRLELLTEMAPGSAGVAALLNMGNPVTAPQLRELDRAARLKGLPFRLFDVRERDDIERAFRAIDVSSEAVVVGLEALTQAHRKLIAELAVKHRLPAIYGGREFVDAGGLMFYGPSFPDIYHRFATYVDKIFKGTKPADLPVEQPTRFELIVNVRAARAIGIIVPATLLARADEVIE